MAISTGVPVGDRASQGILSALAWAFACVLLPPEASAQTLSRVFVRAELGGGRMLTSHQTDALGYGTAVSGAMRVGLELVRPLAVQVSVASGYFPSEQGAGQLYTVGLGALVRPRFGRVGSLFVDFNLGVGSTGSFVPAVSDLGAGFEFSPLPALSVGPFVRASAALSSSVASGAVAVYFTGGVAVSLRIPEDLDPDRDGVRGSDDLCPAEPSGALADAARPGCPMHDADRDGVSDANDLCPAESVGPRADPARRGCPARDHDGDGVADADDLCPDEIVGEFADPSRAGCPLRDADRDGVSDANDLCPGDPSGARPDPARSGCPASDADHDGVMDAEDLCPNEPPGFNPDPARHGCPSPDRDRDAVPDASDACPDNPGAPSPEARRNGCPGLVTIQSNVIRISTPVFFAPRRDAILSRSEPVLRAVADALRATGSIRRVSIEGHTDDLGEDADNLALSQRRAESVMGWLVQHLVDAARLEAHGYGETRPLVPGTTSEARGANRRVEFRIVDPPLGDAPVPPPPAMSPAPAPPEAGSRPHRRHRHH